MDGIRIELDYAAIEKLEKAVLRAVEETVDELRSDVVKEQVMPYDSGDMQTTLLSPKPFVPMAKSCPCSQQTPRRPAACTIIQSTTSRPSTTPTLAASGWSLGSLVAGVRPSHRINLLSYIKRRQSCDPDP